MRSAINKFTSGIVDANGNVKLQFLENPGQGLQWIGNLNVINSPSAAQWSLTIGFQQIGNWTGSAPFGPVKLINQDTALITGTGLNPGATINAQLTGWADLDDYDIVIPNNVPTTAIAVETVVPLLTAAKLTTAAGAAIYPLRPPQNTRRLTICINSSNPTASGNILLLGQQSNIIYPSVGASGWVSNNGVQTIGPIFYVIEPLIDQTYSLYVLGTNGDIVTAWVVASQTNPEMLIAGGNINIDGGGGSTAVDVAFGGTGAPASANSTLVAANGTTPLIPAGQPSVAYLNTLFIQLSGASSAAIALHGVANSTLLALNQAGTVTLPMSGFYAGTLGVDLLVSSFTSGFVVAGITWKAGI